MEAKISELLSHAGDQICDLPHESKSTDYFFNWGILGSQLLDLLSQRNGFFAYESSLLVRPFSNFTSVLGIKEWNRRDLWKGHYEDNLDDVLFFAEDAFGGQFCVKDSAVHFFDPETGSFDEMASSLQAWAEAILSDYEFRTGFPLAREWQINRGAIPNGMRLLPKVPFVCGGAFNIENLYLLNDVKGMQFRASIANQIRDLPDGSQIVFET